MTWSHGGRQAAERDRGWGACWRPVPCLFRTCSCPVHVLFQPLLGW